MKPENKKVLDEMNAEIGKVIDGQAALINLFDILISALFLTEDEEPPEEVSEDA